MTALTQYDRLEAPGLYTPGDGSQRRDVVLSIGSASLTLTDQRDVALAHWSLATIERLNPGRRPAIYAPGPDTPERVETGDDEIIRAIEKIRQAVTRARPKPGRVRMRLTLALVAVGLAVAILWLPGAVTRYAASILPAAARTALAESAVDRIIPYAGAPCDDPAGSAALRTLMGRLGASAPKQVLVLPAGLRDAAHLPGGTVLLNRSVVEDHESPQVVAGYILAEVDRAARTSPMLALLDHAGLRATLTLMTTGTLPETALSGYGEALLTRDPAPLTPATLIARFDAAGIPAAPYAYAVDVTGETTLQLIEADPVPAANARPLLTDGEWVALQGICGG
jgi:hypothetical protein